MKILLYMSVSSASAERSFRVMRRLKTYLRSTMGSKRLSSLALLHIYRDDFPVDSDKIISEFVSRKERRLPSLFYCLLRESKNRSKLVESDSSFGICRNTVLLIKFSKA